jgi:DNA-binding winged helix-turn-helix (wHTH) protein/tetratricopeptide (TPR) repeat protein
VADTATYRFDGWTLDRASGELARDGKAQRLAPQPLAMLIALLDRAGEVVTRDALVQVLWPSGIVDFDNSLNAVVRRLRVALGDDSEVPRYIETLPRIGYRFVGKLDAIADPSPPVEPRIPVAAAPPRYVWAGVAAAIVLAAGATFWFLRPAADPPATVAQTSIPRRTTNERAYDLYLQGIFHRSRRDINGTSLAIQNLEAALQEDPHYADAWAALAETLAGGAMTQTSPTVATYERAKAAALRAIELDDAHGHGYAALAHINMMFDHDFARAEEMLEKARVRDPNYSRTWHSLALLRAFQNRLPEALDAIRRARELEPMTLLYSTNYALLLYNARRFDEAAVQARALIASQPRLDPARSLLIRTLLAKGDVQGALEQLPLRMNERPNLADAGFVYARAGRRKEALAEIERIERMASEGIGVGYDVALIRIALGDLNAACAALERALDDHSLQLPWIRVEPRFDSLRPHPCFIAVQDRLFDTN